MVNPDRLSWMESVRILSSLSALAITPRRLAVNKCSEETDLSAMPAELQRLPRILLPATDQPLLGTEALTQYRITSYNVCYTKLLRGLDTA